MVLLSRELGNISGWLGLHAGHSGHITINLAFGSSVLTASEVFDFETIAAGSTSAADGGCGGAAVALLVTRQSAAAAAGAAEAAASALDLAATILTLAYCAVGVVDVVRAAVLTGDVWRAAQATGVAAAAAATGATST